MTTFKLRDRFSTQTGEVCTVTKVRKDEIRVTFDNGVVVTYPLEEFKKEVTICKLIQQPRLKINRLNVADHLLEYQLNIIGKTIQDAKNDEMWFYNLTLTQEQHNAFKSYAIPLLKEVFKFNKRKAEETFSWFDLQFGLRVKN